MEDIKQPTPKADIVIRHFPGQSMLDAFFESEEKYDRFMAEAPGYGNVSHFDEFVRLHVAPTFDVDEVREYLSREQD
jgi:hypothetical protein